jgi:hypothetical protein
MQSTDPHGYELLKEYTVKSDSFSTPLLPPACSTLRTQTRKKLIKLGLSENITGYAVITTPFTMTDDVGLFGGFVWKIRLLITWRASEILAAGRPVNRDGSALDKP